MQNVLVGISGPTKRTSYVLQKFRKKIICRSFWNNYHKKIKSTCLICTLLASATVSLNCAEAEAEITNSSVCLVKRTIWNFFVQESYRITRKSQVYIGLTDPCHNSIHYLRIDTSRLKTVCSDLSHPNPMSHMNIK